MSIFLLSIFVWHLTPIPYNAACIFKLKSHQRQPSTKGRVQLELQAKHYTKKRDQIRRWRRQKSVFCIVSCPKFVSNQYKVVPGGSVGKWPASDGLDFYASVQIDFLKELLKQFPFCWMGQYVKQTHGAVEDKTFRNWWKFVHGHHTSLFLVQIPGTYQSNLST